MRVLSQPLSVLFGGELKPLSNAHGAVYNSGAACSELCVDGRLELLSWNLLAPCYKRPPEPEDTALARALAQIHTVRASSADVVGLQEFWLAERHVEMWRSFAEDEGFCMLVSPRTGGKQDGCCMLVRRARLARPPVLETFSFDDWGNRVLQVVSVSLAGDAQVIISPVLT
jgi:hypothetical protein